VKALRIPVMEDDFPISMLLAEVLAERGHEVCAVETTQAGAVASAIGYGPDLMIVDAQSTTARVARRRVDAQSRAG
jgi:DNA-binding response OmpR family regulator